MTTKSETCQGFRNRTRGINRLTATNVMSNRGALPIVVGKVNGRDVTTLRDTGSVVIACRESLIPRSEWASGKTIIVTANGAHTKVSKALISIETPYLSGKFIAILLKKLTIRSNCR